MSRIRLTTRLAMNKERIAESQKDGLFPGDVGNEERKKNYREIDEYHTFEQTVNHELPDMRHDWQDNPRDEVGMGIPKKAKASIVTATANATKLAYFLLGEKASDEMIEAQARDFLRLGNDRLSAAVERFAETVDLYEDEDDDCEDCEDEAIETCDETPVVEETPTDEVVAEEIPMMAEEEEAPAVEEVAEEVAEEPVSEISDEDVQVAPESVEAEEAEEEMDDVDFDFGETNAEDEEETPDDLRSVFEETEEEVKTTAPVTAKIQSIGSQPKIASALKADELAGLWDSEKDVF